MDLNLISLFTNYSFLVVLIGTILLAISGGILSCFLVLKKESLVADSITHATLPGVVSMFLLFNTKNLYLMLFGGLISSLISLIIIYLIKQNKKTNINGILATILSSFFGLGLVLLTQAQKNPDAAQAGIRTLIFGQAASISSFDVQVILCLTIITLLFVILFFKEIKITIFDLQFAKVSKINVNFINFCIISLILISVILQIQIIGIILTATMLVTPAVASMQLTNKFNRMIIYSCMIAIISCVIGSVLSTLVSGLSTGPIISFVSGSICFICIVFGKYGVINKFINKKKILGVINES